MKSGFLMTLLIALAGCNSHPASNDVTFHFPDDSISHAQIKWVAPMITFTGRDITLKNYFSSIRQIVGEYKWLAHEPLAEYILVHHNAWILDTLRNLDYYHQKARGKFIYDLSEQVIVRKDDVILIPDSAKVAHLRNLLKSTFIDVNVPEFRLRIIQANRVIFTLPVRVGRNSEEYIESVGRVVNLQTPIGAGEIIQVWRSPIFLDLHSNEKLEKTKRDDGRITLIPPIPSLEPRINGVRAGNLFHATTNLRTVGRAYSHGCIGLSEADAWTLYYYAPVGTKVNIRYDLFTLAANGDTIRLKDIYHLFDKKVQIRR